ncbi:methyltransferase [Moorella thermoacetica]|uniref:Methyltransferase MtaA/CmuA n=1 Tax=Moorella thermoacetica (strain ATCC 39073 / JCM 9320) TaxID=264732 RepID=Q2RGP7_MOOTA|nr:MtaA/CmuA family methyltransferase [Moorella thermoacetica]AKX94937.1 uroporphyrinogen decarboxylase [Moorella thermoacetica]AKX97564.1 uroporphyrinogen decarboxylase [Moorella thermoacetica]OIQ54223.1 uroporphyrinogen decarboxylase [Moorella thermoacetica]QDA01391.1 methylcobalamin:coenzyme M methyltransferase [Moorella thermoacetica]TYL06982.1 Uroporphyrinogen decarboxylase [Moorella thermoacetica]
MSASEQMAGSERVIAAVQGQEVDRFPLVTPTSVVTVESMTVTGVYFPEAHTDPYKMAALAAAGHELLGFDTVTPYFSILLEAAALGCEVDLNSVDAMPAIKINPLKNLLERKWDWRPPANFLDRQPVKALLAAIRLLKKRYGRRVAVVGKVIGPWTLAYHLCGVQDFLLGLVLEPEAVRELLERLLAVPLRLAVAEIEAGVDVLTWADHATSDLVSAAAYRDFLLPLHQRAMEQLAGSCPVILHTCGRATDRVAYFARAGFTAFHFDSRNPVGDLLSLANGRLNLIGGINNPQTLLNGKVKEVRATIEGLLQAGIKMVAPECAVPLRTPNQNLRAIVQAVRDFSRRHRKV